MPQNFAQVYKKIADAWKKEKSSKKCKLKAETAIRVSKHRIVKLAEISIKVSK